MDSIGAKLGDRWILVRCMNHAIHMDPKDILRWALVDVNSTHIFMIPKMITRQQCHSIGGGMYHRTPIILVFIHMTNLRTEILDYEYPLLLL